VVVLDGLVDEHGRRVLEVGADAERVAESTRRDTQHAPAVRVERRQTTELAVRLARLTRVQVVAGLQLARLILLRRRPLSCRRRRPSARRRRRVHHALLALGADAAAVILGLRRYSLKQFL